jgi:molybdopterin-containing oxidoreductase family membrane subunit
MTVFAIMTAGLFPIIHLGRPWFAYWLFPYPNERQLWVNFKSPLIWDVFAISSYMTVSALFLYLGLVPDIAAARDRIKDWRQRVYGVLALGWRGTDRQWRHLNALYGFLAALVTPLAVSVHSVVSWDFRDGAHPRLAQHDLRALLRRGRHLLRRRDDVDAADPRATPAAPREVHAGGALRESGQAHHPAVAHSHLRVSDGILHVLQRQSVRKRDAPRSAIGTYVPFFWMMVFCNSMVPLLFFFKRVRTDLRALFAISIVINIGMWLERFVLIVSSLSHSFDPAEWSGMYHPTWVEVAITAGSFAWFFLLFLLFVKNFPVISMAELKEETTREGMHVA